MSESENRSIKEMLKMTHNGSDLSVLNDVETRELLRYVEANTNAQAEIAAFQELSAIKEEFNTRLYEQKVQTAERIGEFARNNILENFHEQLAKVGIEID